MNDPFLASYLFYDKQRRLSHETEQPLAGDRANARPESTRPAWYRAAVRGTRRRR